MIKYYFLICILFVLDQLSKMYIKASFEYGEKLKVVERFFYITFVENTGAAWSLFQGGRWIFVSITFIMIVVLLIFLHKFKHPLFRISAATIIGGGAGNLLDRIITGRVPDFLDFYIFGYDFPVFNLSDTFTVIGTGLLIIYIIIYEKEKTHANNS